MKCFGCAIEKDLDVFEVSPHAEADSLIDEPIPPLLVLECECDYFPNWRMVVVCFECFHKLAPDLWIADNGWRAINPIVPVENLPEPSNDKWNPRSYEIK